MTRAEKVAEAQRLRAEGLKFREIGERMGAAVSTVDGWLNDPDLSRLRARKAGYAQPCEWCGGPTDGLWVRNRRTKICMSCRRWTEEELLDAIRRWAEEHGGVPPREVDFDVADGWPSERTVARRFGRWNNALRAAGFGVHQDKSPERQAWIEEQLRAGVSTREIADALCVTPQAIHVRMRYRGTTVGAVRRGLAA